MKPLYFYIIFITAICSCKSRVGNDTAVAGVVQQKDSVNAVDTLYDFVSKIYKHNFMKTKPEVLDSLYLSSEFYSLTKKYKEYWPYTNNHWIYDEFAYNPSFKIGKIKQLSDSISTVDVKVSNGDSKSEYQLLMLLEDNKWKVDDFVHELSTEKAIIRNQLGLEIPLRGSMSEYSLKFCEFAEETHEGAFYLYKNKKLVSKNIVEVGGNKSFDGIADTKDGFNIFYSWGHNKYMGDTVLLFKYLKGQFYLYKVIRYYYTEMEEGYDEKRTEDNLETPILFKDVDFEKYLY